MRQSVLDYIKTVALGTFRVSEEVPRDESGTALFFKNKKTIYVDTAAFEEQPIISVLDGLGISSDVTTVSVYFSCDAKNLPANYDDLVNSLRRGRDINPELGFNSREVAVQTSIEADLLLTRVDYVYTKLR